MRKIGMGTWSWLLPTVTSAMQREHRVLAFLTPSRRRIGLRAIQEARRRPLTSPLTVRLPRQLLDEPEAALIEGLQSVAVTLA